MPPESELSTPEPGLTSDVHEPGQRPEPRPPLTIGDAIATSTPEPTVSPSELWPDGKEMSPLDSLYASLCKEFEVVEVSPSVWMQLSEEWKKEAQKGLQIIMVTSGGTVVEETGFEVRPRKFVRVTLCWTAAKE